MARKPKWLAKEWYKAIREKDAMGLLILLQGNKSWTENKLQADPAIIDRIQDKRRMLFLAIEMTLLLINPVKHLFYELKDIEICLEAMKDIADCADRGGSTKKISWLSLVGHLDHVVAIVCHTPKYRHLYGSAELDVYMLSILPELMRCVTTYHVNNKSQTCYELSAFPTWATAANLYHTWATAANLYHSGMYVSAPGELAFGPAERIAERTIELVSDIFPCPYETNIALDPRWLTSTVLDLSLEIYMQNSYDKVPLLGDALMDAGCDNTRILSHLQSGIQHVRGCWIVDLLLNRWFSPW